MYIFLSGIILAVYLYASYYFFKVTFNLMSTITGDFILQVLPGWVLIAIVNSIFIKIYPTFLYGTPLLYLMLYTSVVICLISIMLLVFKKINTEKYVVLVEKIKRNRNIQP